MSNYHNLKTGSIVDYYLSDGNGGTKIYPAIILNVVDADKGIINIKIFAENDWINNGVLPGNTTNTYSLKHF